MLDHSCDEIKEASCCHERTSSDRFALNVTFEELKAQIVAFLLLSLRQPDFHGDRRHFPPKPFDLLRCLYELFWLGVDFDTESLWQRASWTYPAVVP